MKKRLRPDALPVLSVLLGTAGMLLRVWLLLTGGDDKGLYTTGHIADTATYILLAIAAALLFVCTLPLSKDGRNRNLFPASEPAALGCFAAAAGVLITCVSELLRQQDGILLLSLVVGIAASGCLVLAGLCRLQGRRPSYLLHSVVTVYFLLHLISRYRHWSSEPQLQVYFFPMLSGVLLMLSTYQRACLDGRTGSRQMYVFTSQLALFCCFLSVPGGDWLFYLSMILWTMTGLCDLTVLQFPSRMHLPANVLYCMGILESAGHRVYAVGGCVRDALLGLTPHDYDLCTDATPEQICGLFASHRLVRSGEQHGTIGVVMDEQVYEITTFRTEGSYTDGRHPDHVEFVPRIGQDLARRDFTVNAIAYAPRGGFVDPWDGRADLQNRILRAVGNPTTRFTEDSLRILRGIRFALRFGLLPEAKTLAAMKTLAPLMDRLAAERVFSELCGILPLITPQALLELEPIFTQVIPELSACVGFHQHTPHHAYDVYTHTAYVTGTVAPSLPLRLAALLHDIAKPDVFYKDEQGQGHFPEHARVGAEKADEILRRLKAPTALREQVVFLIAHHMTPFEPDLPLLRRRLNRYGEANCRLLLQLQKADFCSKGVTGDDPAFDQIETMLDQILQEGSCLQLRDLSINGNDLIELGFTPGPMLGQTLQTLLEQVLDEQLPNERTALLTAAKEMNQPTAKTEDTE